MNPRRLFVASCISLIASAFSFVIRQDVLPALGRSFDLSATNLGLIGGMAFWGMATAMVIGSFVVDALGMKRMLALAFICHLLAPMDLSKLASTRWPRRSIQPRRRIA
jgi:MFS family permease